MKRFEGKCLESVYELAKSEYNCSITQLEIEIIQQPSKGFLGFWKKNAIIEVSLKEDKNTIKNSTSKSFDNKNVKIEEVSKKVEESKTKRNYQHNKEKKRLSKVPKLESKDKIFDNFYSDDKSNAYVSNIVIKKDKEEIISEIKEGLNLLFSKSCYKINQIKIDFYDENTIYIEFSGDDSALLIGKEGYRYKALSYILFNWINEKYDLMLRLEVAEFLKNQEEAINVYLEPIFEIIKEKGSFKTKPLDGILVHIALTKLREEFPDKYVAVKTNIKGDKYVLVNEYRPKEK